LPEDDELDELAPEPLEPPAEPVEVEFVEPRLELGRKDG
jgi:hypothetical protein